MPFTHLDAEGRARMVDVGDKPVTRRTAIAEAVVKCDLRATDDFRPSGKHSIRKNEQCQEA